MPPFSTILRVSRWIAFTTLILVGVWSILLVTKPPPETAQAGYSAAIDDYRKGNYFQSYKKYRQIVGTTSNVNGDSIAIRYREMATAIAQAAEAGEIDEQLAAGEYARLQRKAYEAADSLGNDSLKSEAAISALNARLYCDENGFKCGKRPSQADADASQSALRLALPFTFIVIVFACIAVVLLVYPIPSGTDNMTN